MFCAVRFVAGEGVQADGVDGVEDAFLDAGVGLFQFADQFFGFEAFQAAAFIAAAAFVAYKLLAN